MKKDSKGLMVIVLTSFLLTVAFGGVLMTQTSSGAAGTMEGNNIKTVVPSEVCMVNDTVFGREQIPVEYEGKTYYGCCKNCVGRIKEDSSVRYSRDPVTGGVVDKALAIILEGVDGQALYFESIESAEIFHKNLKN
jgi:YHS domain-containing protein